ncbi:hypothetical protein JVT61DRAFT_8748 [Boletus reticuloceps]|uniref:DUF6830 domain-containing protein n=1 Tax=Boletus reticuloceps TaxID=495285 RepID=A0A8I2YHW1_9AGAM|nr:hypothetical protein JVT61DRAFT_8748 [Boletus reticuloceps]
MDVLCPSCYKAFPSEEAFLRHINDSSTTCITNLERLINQNGPTVAYNIPVPPAFRRGAEDTNTSGEYHPTSGFTHLGKGETLLDRLKGNQYERRRENVPYYPFQDEGEWDLAKFLALNLTKSQISQFLKLKWFEQRPRPSFNTVDKLFGWLASLPQGTQWQSSSITFNGFKTTHPIRFLYRNTLDVVQELFSNPMFARYMTYDPHVVMKGEDREYSEFFTGTRAYDIQNQLPPGATIIPIILASDKTPVTRQTGGLQMHPVFMTIGNIQSDVRMQATSHAWRCVAFIPSAEFEVHPDFKTILLARLFHHCMDEVVAPLKYAALHGVTLSDAMGCIRHCYTPLVSYIVDLPEQQLIACVAMNASPVTVAEKSEFGNPEPAEPRTGKHTLVAIVELCKKVDPWDLVAFQKAAKLIRLLGVHKPFWRNWKFADPSLFLTGEILHTCHKFFFDHVLTWCKELIGAHTLDTRFKHLHRRVAVRHFSSGVTHVVQMTGRDHRDIERTIVPLIAGVVPDQFISPIRAMVEFIYRAQDPVHTNLSIVSMEQALHDFHAGKHVILDLEARTSKSGPMDHFNIPKLELMQSFSRQTKANGALIQFTADVTEHLLITHCKNVFSRTSRNHLTFVDQAVEILNREEAIRLFDLYLILRQSSDSAFETALTIENDEVTTIDPALSFLQHVLPEKESTFRGPRPFRNYFRDCRGLVSSDGAVAFHVTVRPDHAIMPVVQMQALHKLPDLPQVLSDYIYAASNCVPTCGWGIGDNVAVWNKFRLQLHSSFRLRFINRSQVVQAFPPSDRHPLGCCDAVLLSRSDSDDIFGKPNYHWFTFLNSSSKDVAQVRAVFMPKTKNALPAYPGTVPLLYVRYFRIMSLPTQSSIGLYQVERMQPFEARASSIVPLTDVILAVDLVPVFDTSLPGVAECSETCMEGYSRYYLNSFTDKETFHLVYES